MLLRSTLLLATALTCFGQAQPPPNPVRDYFGQNIPAINTMSVEQERAVGAQMFEGVRQRATPSRDAAAQAYVDRVAGRLIGFLPTSSPFPIYFTVVDSLAIQDQMGAPIDELTALPGGYVFVPLGLVRSTREEELAGLMAHAIGHILHRDQAKDQMLTQVIGMATLPLVMISTKGGHPLVKDGVRQAANYAAPLAIAAIERKFESDADTFAVRLTATAGYDPAGLHHFVAREPDPVGTLQLLLSRYPRPSARAISMEKAIAKLRPVEPPKL